MKKIGIISDTHSYWDEKYLHYFEPPVACRLWQLRWRRPPTDVSGGVALEV